jgi:photosystem II stability/assembly factor-like uncharacterized protein
VWLARITVFALLLAVSGAAQARTIRQVVPTSVAFWTRDHGLVGSVAYGPTARSEGQLAVTRDGGKTWRTTWRGRAVFDVSVVPRTGEAWATIAPRSCLECPPDLLRTRDGGRTWHRAARAYSIPSFPSAQVGYALRSRQAHAGPLMRTLDGGRTWRQVPSPCRRGWGGYAWSAAISFVSPSHGWIVCAGQPGAGSQAKAIYETVDGTARWRRLLNVQFEPGHLASGGMTRLGYPRGISFTRSGRGLLWAARSWSFRTVDSGRHWRPVRATSPEEREGLSGWLVSDRVGYLLLEDNEQRNGWQLLRTADGGGSWRLVHSWVRR